MKSFLRAAIFLVLPVIFVAAWAAAKAWVGIEDNKLPSPAAVATHFTEVGRDGQMVAVSLLANMRATATEALLGLAIALPLGIAAALAIAYVPTLGKGLLPLVVGAQNVPLIALAPPLLVWLGTDWKSKSIIAAYIAFFPLVVFAVRGFTSTPPRQLALMRSLAAGRWQTFWRVRLPNAIPHLFTGLRTAAALAVVGAIVAELPVGSREGIGTVIFNAAQFYTFNPAALFTSTAAAFVLGVGFFGAVVALDVAVRRLMRLRA